MARRHRFGETDSSTISVEIAWADTPAGRFWVGATPAHVVASQLDLDGIVKFEAVQARQERFVDELGLLGYEASMSDELDELAHEAAGQARAFLAGERRAFELPLLYPPLTPFGRAVMWEVTHAVPFGHTATYGDIAARTGRPGAARAVGAVMAACPFSLFVPCHRVVRSASGTRQATSGSRWDGQRERLLAFERRMSVGDEASVIAGRGRSGIPPG